MSYILDALKRAESERSRGAVPGVHAQPQAAATTTPQSRSRVVWVLAGAVALTAVGAGLWWLTVPAAVRTSTAPSPVAPAAPVAVVVPTPVQAPAAPVVAAPAAVLPPIPPLPVVPPPPAAPTAPTAQVPAPVAVAKASAPAPTAPARQQPRVPTLAELPDTVRQQLPTLAISGGTYSENPLYRMVIVNGQVLHEGDTAAPGVVLEKIRQKEVVLRAQGQRYTVPY